jgi:aminomethyltransferase
MLDPTPAKLLQTPLHALHLARGGKMVPFAGYDMPVQYPTGVLKEHLQTRAGAGLFDVSAASATPSSPTRQAAFSTI